MNNPTDLPEIPDKRYFAIGEVSALCDVRPHVLRYWEQEFTQLKPCKRRGNRRYYRREDVHMVRKIRNLLYEQGFTIGGARQQLNHTTISKKTLPLPYSKGENEPQIPTTYREIIQDLQSVLEDLR